MYHNHTWEKSRTYFIYFKINIEVSPLSTTLQNFECGMFNSLSSFSKLQNQQKLQLSNDEYLRIVVLSGWLPAWKKKSLQKAKSKI